MITEKKKTEARILLSVLTAFVLIFAMSQTALADDAKTVNVKYKVGDVTIPSTTFDLYKVGRLNGTKIILDSPYDKSCINVDLWKDSADAGDWAEAASSLYSYIKAKGLGKDSLQHPVTDAGGNMSFSGEHGCVYLLGTEKETKVGDTVYRAQPMLIWVINGKVSDLTIKPEQSTTGAQKYMIIKHWKNDDPGKRPSEIEIGLYKNDKFEKNIKLDKDNNWCYEWTDKGKKARWTCVEKDTEGYKYTTKEIKENGTVKIILTNTGEGTPTPTPPQTGDPTSFRWVILAMAVSGLALVVLAIRRRREE